jgi:hypothetical protein
MSDSKKSSPTAQQIKQEIKIWLNSLERGGTKTKEQNKPHKRRG